MARPWTRKKHLSHCANVSANTGWLCHWSGWYVIRQDVVWNHRTDQTLCENPEKPWEVFRNLWETDANAIKDPADPCQISILSNISWNPANSSTSVQQYNEWKNTGYNNRYICYCSQYSSSNTISANYTASAAFANRLQWLNYFLTFIPSAIMQSQPQCASYSSARLRSYQLWNCTEIAPNEWPQLMPRA